MKRWVLLEVQYVNERAIGVDAVEIEEPRLLVGETAAFTWPDVRNWKKGSAGSVGVSAAVAVEEVLK